MSEVALYVASCKIATAIFCARGLPFRSSDTLEKVRCMGRRERARRV